MEYAATEDIEDRNDYGYLVKVEHDRGGLRVSGGYIDLGEHFSAEYADPIRQVSSDARGGEVNLDYMSRGSVWKFKNIGGGLRLFNMKKHSNDEKIKEGDGSLRFGLGDKDTFLFNWFGREDGQNRTKSLIWSGRHAWNKAFASGLQANFTSTKTSYTWRWMVDTSLREGRNFYRLAFERIRRVIENSAESPYEESSFYFDVNRGPWRFNLTARHSRRHTDSGNNFFGRVEYGPEFLHRYRLISYVALGNRAAFETEKQIEMGLELRF